MQKRKQKQKQKKFNILVLLHAVCCQVNESVSQSSKKNILIISGFKYNGRAIGIEIVSTLMAQLPICNERLHPTKFNTLRFLRLDQVEIICFNY